MRFVFVAGERFSRSGNSGSDTVCKRLGKGHSPSPPAPLSALQSRNVRVAYESRTGFAILNFALVRMGHFKVEYAYSEALLALVSATVAGTPPLRACRFFSPVPGKSSRA